MRATPRPAARAPPTRDERDERRGASRELARPLRRATSATAPSTTPIAPTTSATIASVELLPPPPSELFASTVGAGVSETLGAVPVDDRAVGVGLLDLERVGLRRRRRRPRNWKSASSPGRRRSCRRVQVTFWITASSPEPVCLHLALPAGRGDERVDREAVGHGQHDLRRRRVLLLGRDGEGEELAGLRERDGRADAGRGRTRIRRRRRRAPRRAATARGKRSLHRCAPFTLTSSVNGAVTTRPPTLVWRNRRHVPGAGTSTPTVSLPGFAERAGDLARRRGRSCSRSRRARRRGCGSSRASPCGRRSRARARRTTA